jgi:hypothetical protein
MSLFRNLPALVFAAAATAAAFAQTPAAPATSPADAGMRKHACSKPGNFPGNLASELQKRSWQKEYVGYTDCLKKFISDEKALAEPHVKAYNAAVDEYNEGVRVFNEQIEKAREK